MTFPIVFPWLNFFYLTQLIWEFLCSKGQYPVVWDSHVFHYHGLVLYKYNWLFFHVSLWFACWWSLLEVFTFERIGMIVNFYGPMSYFDFISIFTAIIFKWLSFVLISTIHMYMCISWNVTSEISHFRLHSWPWNKFLHDYNVWFT